MTSPSEPLVSVVIIFLNAERFLEAAIRSVLAQQYANWELLLVDDGSTDGSEALARQVAAEHPTRVKYLTHPGRQNKGMSASRNLGFARAAGELVALLDADDVWLPEKLARQVAIMNAHPEAAMVYGPSRYWHPDEPHRDFTQNIGFVEETVCHPPALALRFLEDSAGTPVPGTLLLRSRVLRELGGFVEQFRGMYEDQAFCFKAALHAPIVASPECWVLYRQHADSCCSVAFASGAHVAARQRFLRWCAAYLDETHVNDPAVRAMIARERRAVSPQQRARAAIRRTVGRVLPPPVRSWLRGLS